MLPPVNASDPPPLPSAVACTDVAQTCTVVAPVQLTVVVLVDVVGYVVWADAAGATTSNPSPTTATTQLNHRTVRSIILPSTCACPIAEENAPHIWEVPARVRLPRSVAIAPGDYHAKRSGLVSLNCSCP